MKSIWVIIVTFNAAKWVEKCLNSVKESTVNVNVVVVDNHSSDETLEILHQSYPEIKIISNAKNEGFGVANNTGLRYALEAGADYLVLLNQDAKLSSDTLECLSNYAQQYPDYGILSPMFYSYDGSKLDLYLLNWVFNYDLLLASDIYFKRPKDVYDVHLMPAAMWFIRREALEEAGGFDPLFFMYGEDEDLWSRMNARGWKTGFFPKTLVYHNTTEGAYTIKKRIWQKYAGSIIALKNNNRSYLMNVVALIKSYFKSSLNAVLDLNKSELYVTQLVFIKTMGKLKTVYINRKQSYKGMRPFLN